MVVVTFAVHIPLNDELKQAGDPSRIENLAAVRDDFVTPWVAWDIVRTLATTAAFGSSPGQSSCTDARSEPNSHKRPTASRS